MKDRIITILALVSLALTILLMWKGLETDFITIYSIQSLNKKNEEVNLEIAELAELTSSKYMESIENLETAEENLEKAKDKYYELLELTSDKETNIYETEKYDIGYLWTIIGRCATENELDLGMEVAKSGEYYNLQFTLKGSYNNISKFISDIENNSELQFRIYNFKLVPGEQISGAEDTRRLEASFVVKDVNLDKETLVSTKKETLINNKEALFNTNKDQNLKTEEKSSNTTIEQ